ncbi:uncharacterized protein [Rutidosis leptorrhynchoides]|uniref:uncharacterized protein n=1 Tax=Rutidosis leptorrhynchoides TaxID=125765 RepID=UPI003A997EDA
MRSYHLSNGPPRCAFKVDIQKAYDTVEWSFLESNLVRFGFHQTMIRWIMKCVTTVSYSININGDLHGYFKGKRGLRQGDPMSPYLFTLVMEVLTLLLVRNACLSDFRYHPNCEEHEIINLCFADDLFIFSHADYNSVQIINAALEQFKDWSGLVPSMPKSTAFFANVTNSLKEQILGRVQLINSVLSSMQLHWQSVLLLPSAIIKEIECLMRGFLWCQGDMKKGKAKVKWAHVCLPKEEGGLGIRRLKTWNIALLTTHWKDRSGNNCDFSIKHVWESLRPTAPQVHWFSIVWHPYCIPRHAFVLWLLMGEKLKTQDSLQAWEISQGDVITCALCNMVPDSHDHLFFSCGFASRVWSLVLQHCEFVTFLLLPMHGRILRIY